MVKTLKYPDEAICMLVYPTRRSTETISEMLYNKRNSRIGKRIEKLEKLGWVKKKTDYGKDDGRYSYWQATPKCMVDYFEMHLEKPVKFDDIEKEWLFEVFSSDDFKGYIASQLFSNPIEPVESLSFSSTRRTFVLLSALILFLREYAEKNIKFDSGTLMELLVNSNIENDKYSWFWNKFSSLNNFTLNKFLYLDEKLAGSIIYSFTVLTDIIDNKSKSI